MARPKTRSVNEQEFLFCGLLNEGWVGAQLSNQKLCRVWIGICHPEEHGGKKEVLFSELFGNSNLGNEAKSQSGGNPVRILIVGGCGFIGSTLYRHLESTGHAVCSMDRLDRGNPGGVKNAKTDYRDIAPFHNIEAADVIIHLAGHSSVASCDADPWGSVANNVTNFLPFVKRLAGLDNPPLLLWASSGSVLSDVHSIYDEQKRAREALVPRLYPRSIGLRFASVCGVSPNMRDDIILNAMVKSAITTGVINMANPLVYKPILGLKNLCACVEYLIEHRTRWRGPSGAAEPDIIDLCSFTTSPEQAAQAVSAFTGAKINRLPPSQAYEFRMREWLGMEESLESIIAELADHYRGRADV